MKLTKKDIITLKEKAILRHRFNDLKIKITSKPNASKGFKAQQNKLIKEVDNYLKMFAKQKEDNKCIFCDRKLDGFLGTFEWGLAHGEGYCGGCGYPARAKHCIKIDGIGELSFSEILQYHPQELRAE